MTFMAVTYGGPWHMTLCVSAEQVEVEEAEEEKEGGRVWRRGKSTVRHRGRRECGVWG